MFANKAIYSVVWKARDGSGMRSLDMIAEYANRYAREISDNGGFDVKIYNADTGSYVPFVAR